MGGAVKTVLTLLTAMFSLASLAHAQADASTGPCTAHPGATYEVTVVKPSSTPPGHNSINAGLESVKATATLNHLIESAYDLRAFQLTGGPAWISNIVWDVQGKIDPPETNPAGLDTAARKAWIARQRERMQSLLADRFQLTCHFADKQLPVFELQVDKAGAKLQDTAAPENKQHSIGTSGNATRVDFRGTGVTLEEVAAALSGQLERMVIDKTGLTGKYDMHLLWSRETAPAPDADTASLPSVFTAVEEQLGLKLVPAKGPVRVLVIDAVEKPSEN